MTLTLLSPLPQSLAALITVLNQFPDSCSSQHTNSGGKIIYKRLEFLFEDISLVTNFSVQRKCALISNILNKTLKAVCGIYLMICEGRFVKIFLFTRKSEIFYCFALMQLMQRLHTLHNCQRER